MAWLAAVPLLAIDDFRDAHASCVVNCAGASRTAYLSASLTALMGALVLWAMLQRTRP